jgi:hypothetical protein
MEGVDEMSGWIEWNGGWRPVDDDAIVDIQFRDGETLKSVRNPNDFRWWHDGCPDCRDIIAYRVVKSEASEDDIVNHPPHYTTHPSGIECIDVTKHMDFCLGNAMKYLWRAGEKDETKTVEDLKKAVWYINKKIEMLGDG